jgi:chromosome partitioning protein
MVESIVPNLFVLPSNVNLTGAEIELIGFPDMEHVLADAISPIKDFFDYVLIDCPPSLNILTVNAMSAASSVLVPIQCEFYALEGLSQLLHTIDIIRTRINKNLTIEGICFTMFDARTNLSLQVVENVRANLPHNIYHAVIPRNVKLAEAPSHGKPIHMYDPKSSGAAAYNELADELIYNEVQTITGH